MQAVESRLSSSVVEAACCPISLEPYEEAQIVSCQGSHSFSLSATVRVFGAMLDNSCERPGPCPLCRQFVTSYQKNTPLQSLVDAILGIDQGKAHYMSMREVLKKQRLLFEVGAEYPLEKTEFVLREEIYKPTYHSVILDNKCRREKECNSIKVFCLSIQNAKIDVNIFFQDEDVTSKHKIEEYLKNSKIQSCEIMSCYQGVEIRWSSKENALDCVRLIMQFNEFDDRSKTALKKVIQRLELMQ